MAKKKKGTSLAFKTGMGVGFFEEFILKQTDAEERLARTFAAFIKLPVGGYFICGGNVPPTHFSNDNFRCVVIGHSLLEIDQGVSLLRGVGSRITSLFTEKDFHSTVAMDFLSKYLKAHIQKMKFPQALAVEFIIIDFRNNLFRIHFTGDIEIDDLSDNSEEIFILGGYNERFRRGLASELKKLPKEVNLEKMKIFAEKLVRKFKLSCCGFIL